MSEDSQEKDSIAFEVLKEDVPKEEINQQFGLYALIFLINYYLSWLLAGFIFLSYFLIEFMPNVLQVTSFITLFTDPKSLVSLLLMPLIVIACYVIRMIFVGITTRIFWRISERISPSKDGVIPRNIKSKAADYYHLRSFMLKYGKNLFTKGMFPWLSNWFFNFVGSSKIGKGTTLEESVASDKHVTVGKNTYMGVNATLASHLVQAIFGNIQYFRMHVGDNVTMAAMNQIGPGSEIMDGSYLLPLASTNRHSVLKGGHNYYFGIPLRKIFKNKTMNYLGVTEEDLEKNENMQVYLDKIKSNIPKKERKSKKEKKTIIETSTISTSEEIKELKKNKVDINDLTKEDLAIDFTTSSAISRINIKFLIVYIPILWLGGLIISIFWYEYTKGVWDFSNQANLINSIINNISTILFLPIAIFIMIYLFILGVLFFSKLLLIFINMIHLPKEGIFLAEVGNVDYDFWMFRTELKKIALWLLRNGPVPWADVIALKWFGVNMDSSSHLYDAWCDVDFVSIGRKVLIGQGATIMSSMVIGKYLIIKRVVFDDYVMVGGHTTIAPGTIMGHDSVIGAISSTTYNRVLDSNYIYFGIPAIPLKENKYAEERRDIVIKRHVDESKKMEETHEVNIDEDKKKYIKTGDDE
ncbi:MAG: hypothetical protein KGD73_02635 [Candidatus Lokiarchaeota archaeon]|nr:hypothetical protein [Candidatus Lokiarchaeota archaeon]